MNTKVIFINSLGSLFDLSSKKVSSLNTKNNYELYYEIDSDDVIGAWKDVSNLISESYCKVKNDNYSKIKLDALRKNIEINTINISNEISFEDISKILNDDYDLPENIKHQSIHNELMLSYDRN
jgi:hypothetical protein